MFNENIFLEGTIKDQTKEISQPDDTLSRLSFHPDSNILAGSCWDSNVYIYDANSQQCIEKIEQKLPVLSCCWNSQDGNKLFTCGCDNNAYMWDMDNPKEQVIIANHDSPINVIKYIPDHHLVLTGGWDRFVSLWDMRTTIRSCKSLMMPSKIYCADIDLDNIVIGTGLNIREIDLRTFTETSSNITLTNFPRCIRQMGRRKFLVGTEKQLLRHSTNSQRQRRNLLITRDYAFHDICVNMNEELVVTCNGNGELTYYSGYQFQNGTVMARLPYPITCGAINYNGSMIAYSSGYDWSQGNLGYSKEKMKSKLYIKNIDEQILNEIRQTQRQDDW